MKRFILIITISLFAIFSSFAQFKGIITNAKQRPLKGMKVWRKNSTESVKTNESGAFLFQHLVATDTLVISVSKKEEAVIPVKDFNNIVIVLDKKSFIIHDGSKEYKREYQKIYRLSHSSNILTREQIEKMSATSIYDVLRGTLPGVTVSEGNYGLMITIRGGNSFELNTEPLFILDGTQYESSADVDSQITVSDIEKIEVQKDGAAYGMKGANGVIIITTMKK